MIRFDLNVPSELVGEVSALLFEDPCVINIGHVPKGSMKPSGDLFSFEVPREHASMVVEGLKDLGLHQEGGIALTTLSSSVGKTAIRAEQEAPGSPVDAVVWEDLADEVEEISGLSLSFVAMILLASIIAAVGIMLDSTVLIVGAMVVGPEFGPIAATCVALAQRKLRVAARAFLALAVGLPASSLIAYLLVIVGKAVGAYPGEFKAVGHSLAVSIAAPDVNTIIVALAAGAAGMLSLTTAKSGALVGVLVSVTTIPAAANIGVALAYSDGHGAYGSAQQLFWNVVAILVAGAFVVVLQRTLFEERLKKKLSGQKARK